jgi:hypothetical protein
MLPSYKSGNLPRETYVVHHVWLRVQKRWGLMDSIKPPLSVHKTLKIVATQSTD